MKLIPAIIERAEDGTYSVYCKNEIFSGMGATIPEAKADMHRQMAVYKETALKEGFKYPEFLDEEHFIEYTVDALSLMNYYEVRNIFLVCVGKDYWHKPETTLGLYDWNQASQSPERQDNFRIPAFVSGP